MRDAIPVNRIKGVGEKTAALFGKINVEKRVISLNLQIDPKICSMYEYFEIFLGRMMMCKRAAEVLEASFKLTVNGAKVL